MIKIFSIYTHPDKPEPEKAVLVKEGFNIYAFAFGVLWLFYQRLWWGAFWLMALQASLQMTMKNNGFSSTSVDILLLALQFLLGIFASDIIKDRLKTKGYALTDITAANSQPEANMRFLDKRLAV